MGYGQFLFPSCGIFHQLYLPRPLCNSTGSFGITANRFSCSVMDSRRARLVQVEIKIVCMEAWIMIQPTKLQINEERSKLHQVSSRVPERAKIRQNMVNKCKLRAGIAHSRRRWLLPTFPVLLKPNLSSPWAKKGNQTARTTSQSLSSRPRSLLRKSRRIQLLLHKMRRLMFIITRGCYKIRLADYVCWYTHPYFLIENKVH